MLDERENKSDAGEVGETKSVVLEPDVPADGVYAGPVVVKKGFNKAKWDWVVVRKAYFDEGLTIGQVAKRFNIPVGTVAKRQARENWPRRNKIAGFKKLQKDLSTQKMNEEVWERWIRLIREDSMRNLGEILSRGPRSIGRMSEKEIKEEKLRLSLLKDYQDLVTQHQTQGARLRAIEREEYPAEEDAGELDMAAMVVYTRQPRPLCVDQMAIDVTSEAMARDKELKAVRSVQAPTFKEAERIAPEATKIVREEAERKANECVYYKE